MSYRRSDEPGYVGRLADGLRAHFGQDRVFVDIDDMVFGEKWQTQIETIIKGCSVVLAIIGRRWESELLERNSAAVSKRDVLQFELNYAKSHGIPVVPILLNKAQLPDKEALGELSWLRDDHVFNIRDGQNQWQQDIEKLVTHIAYATDLKRSSKPLNRHFYWMIPAGIAALVLASVGIALTRSENNDSRTADGGFASDFPIPLGQLAHDWTDAGNVAIMLDEPAGSTEAKYLNNLKFPAGSGKQSNLIEQFCTNNSGCIACTVSPAGKEIHEADLVTIRFTGSEPPTEQELLTADNTNSWPIKEEYLPWENIDRTTGKRTVFTCSGD